MTRPPTPPNCFTALHMNDIADLRKAFGDESPTIAADPKPDPKVDTRLYVSKSVEGTQDRGTSYEMSPGDDAKVPVVKCERGKWSVQVRFVPFRLAPIFRVDQMPPTKFCRNIETPGFVGRTDSRFPADEIQRFEWDVTKLTTDGVQVPPPWTSIIDPLAVPRLPTEIRAEYAVFPLSYTSFSSVRNLREGEKCSELAIEGPALRYAGPSLGKYDRDGQSADAVFQPDRVAEAAFYQAVAYVLFLGIPIVFESSDAGQHPEVFARTFVRHLVGVYRAYPSLIRLIQKEQLTLLLKIDNFPATRLHELVQRWRHAMLECCPEREIEVRYFASLRGEDFIRSVKTLRFQRGTASMAQTAIPGCIPRGFINLGPNPTHWVKNSIEFLEHARNISRMRIWEQNWGDQKSQCTFVDVGQVSSTLAIASQVSGALFCDGAPGSVKMQIFRSLTAPNYKNWQGMVLKTRDPNSVMANALVFAVAFAVSRVVVIPTGLPIDALIWPIRIAVERADELLLSPDFRLLPEFVPRRIILFSQDGTRPLEEIAAVELLGSLLAEMGVPVTLGVPVTQGAPGDQALQVSATAEPNDIIQAISGLSSKVPRNAERLADFIAGFGVVNDYAEYLGLDDE